MRLGACAKPRWCEVARPGYPAPPGHHRSGARGPCGGGGGLAEAVYFDPDSPLAYFLTGSLLFRQDRRQEGRRALEVAAELLASLSRDTAVLYGHGVTAGQLLDLAQEYLTLCGDGRATANAGGGRR